VSRAADFISIAKILLGLAPFQWPPEISGRRAAGANADGIDVLLVVKDGTKDHVLLSLGGLEEDAVERENRQAHWENVYRAKPENEVSWFQESPAPSLELIEYAGASHASAIIDIGGGASRLVDNLVEEGFENLTVLDLSSAALDTAKSRVGRRAGQVHWVVADVTIWQPVKAYDIWHDRAAFHFLTEESDRAAYVERLNRGLKIGGYAIIGTFALEGPERCSGLQVARYDAASLGQVLGPAFSLVHSLRHEHTTPWGSQQAFQFSIFRREG
jgi:SAM-dependent methyltransferase